MKLALIPWMFLGEFLSSTAVGGMLASSCESLESEKSPFLRSTSVDFSEGFKVDAMAIS